MKSIRSSLIRAASVAGIAGVLGLGLVTPALAAVAAHLTATPTTFYGPCPAVITFNGKIKSTVPGEVKYKFTRSDGAIAPVQTLIFRAPGIQSVGTTWTLGGIPALPSYVGWEAIEIVSPMAFTSPHANFKIRCRPQTAPGH